MIYVTVEGLFTSVMFVDAPVNVEAFQEAELTS